MQTLICGWADKFSVVNNFRARMWASGEVIGSAPAMSATQKTTVMYFGAFELDLEAGKLLKNGRIVRLRPQPFRLLSLLVAQPGRLVTREEIQSALWKDDTFVDFEQGVNFAVKQVREALGDRAESSVYIQTVPKRGYRFVAPVAPGGHQEPLLPGTALTRSCSEPSGRTSSIFDFRRNGGARRFG